MDDFFKSLGIGAGASTGVLIGAISIPIIFGIFCCCCCFMLFVGMVIMGEGADSNTRSRRPPRATEREERPQQSRQPRIGEDVFVGDIRWKVLEATDLGNTLTDDNEFTDDLTTSGKFIQVRFEIENMGAETQSFSDVNLIDHQNRSFEDRIEAHTYIDDAEECSFEQLNPNLPKICTQIFEIPADASRLKLQVGDLEMFGSDEAMIDLGLN